MGLSPFSRSSYDGRGSSGPQVVKVIVEHVHKRRKRVQSPLPRPLPNPNPKNYIINRSQKIGHYLITDITYPDCTNYEGHKLLLFFKVSQADLQKQGSIDPHFSNNKKMISPIARFEPTPNGWRMARLIARRDS